MGEAGGAREFPLEVPPPPALPAIVLAVQLGLQPGPEAGACILDTLAPQASGPEPGPHQEWMGRMLAKELCRRSSDATQSLPQHFLPKWLVGYRGRGGCVHTLGV